jgi:hypothetical protein
MSMATITDPRHRRYGGAAAWDPYLAGTPDSGAAMEPTATALGLLSEPAVVMVEQLFTALAARLWPNAAAGRLTVDWDITDLGGWHRMVLSGGDLVHWPIATARPGADVVVRITGAQLCGIVTGAGLDGLPATGDPAAWRRLTELLSPVRVPRAIDDPVTEPLGDPVAPGAGRRRRDRTAESLRVPVGTR